MPRRSTSKPTKAKKPGGRRTAAPPDARTPAGRRASPSGGGETELPETLAALERSLLGTPKLTAPEVAARAGVHREHTRRLWQALGLTPVPDEARVFTATDLSMLAVVRDLIAAGIARPDVLLQMARVIGQSLSRIAEAQVSVSAERAEQLALDSKGSTNETSALVSAIELLVPHVEPLLAYVWRRQLVAALMRAVTDRQAARGQALTVGFADLVGFTAVSQTLAAPEIASLIGRFESLANERITERGGRIVKMIGDEVMFSMANPEDAAEVALALVEAYAGDEATPQVRVGLAFGPALPWEGDLLGPTVNLASRLVNIAYPGTVLVSDEIGKVLTAHERYALREPRPRTLKGLGKVPFWVLRRCEEPRKARRRTP